MYRVLVYVTPGYLDDWAIRYWLYRVVCSARKTIAETRIYVMGTGGLNAVDLFCRHHKYKSFRLDPPDPKNLKLSLRRVINSHQPDMLLAFSKGGELVWQYATMAMEMGLRTILTASVGGDHN